MKSEQLLSALAIVLLPLMFMSCESDEKDTDPDDPSGGKVTISGVSKQYAFWGEEITISGTGFSSVKAENIVTFVNSSPRTPGLKLTSDDGDIEIVDASPTSIKIIVPYETELIGSNTIHRGEDFARIEVSVNNEKDTSDMVKFIGLPRIGWFEYHYGWWDLGGVARSGDSVVIDAGFFGSFTGAGERHPKEAGVYDKLRLHVDGIFVPMKWRKITSSTYGYGIYLPSEDFSEVNCDEGANGWNDRAMNFTFSVEGTNIENTRPLYVTYLPEYSVTDWELPVQVSKSAGGNPFLTVTGEDMYFSHAVFATNCPGASNAEVLIANPGTFNDSYQVSIPLSLLVENCGYTVYLRSICDDTKGLGTILVKP